MKTFASVIAVGTLGLFAVCDLCRPALSASTAARTPAHLFAAAEGVVEQKAVTLRIEGMTCGGCAILVDEVRDLGIIRV
jgi:hypothetical protein